MHLWSSASAARRFSHAVIPLVLAIAFFWLPGQAHAQCVASGVDKICTNRGILAGGGGFGLSTPAGGTNFIYNWGTITGSFGISAAAGVSNRIFNWGRVAGTAFGISAASPINIINNWGTISGVAAAISAAGATSNTVNSYAGSRIIGALTFAGASNNFNFIGGNYLFTVVGSNLAFNASGAPFAVSGNRVAVVDPTPFAVADRNLMDFTRAISSAVPVLDGQSASIGGVMPTAFAEPDAPSGFGSAFANIPGMSAYASDAAMLKNPTVQYSDGSAVWGRGFLGQRVQQADGVLLHTVNQFYGGMIGGDWQARPNLRLGAFVGAGSTRSTVDFDMGSNDTDLVFGGLFGRYRWGASSLGMALQGGHSRTDSTRNVNNNLAAGGIEVAKAMTAGTSTPRRPTP